MYVCSRPCMCAAYMCAAAGAWMLTLVRKDEKVLRLLINTCIPMVRAAEVCQLLSDEVCRLLSDTTHAEVIIHTKRGQISHQHWALTIG